MTKIQPTTSCLDDRKNYAVFCDTYDSTVSVLLQILQKTKSKIGFSLDTYSFFGNSF